MQLNEELVRSFKVAKLFHHDTEQINAIDFSENGELLISCSDGYKIRVYDGGKGEHLDTTHSQKYGVGLKRFANANKTVLHSSTKVANAIRYLRLENKHYLRYYPKHTDKNFKLDPEQECDLTGMKFSRDGKMLLLSTNGLIIRILDAFNGASLKTFTGFSNNLKVPMESTFSADSQFIFSGSSDGRVHVWKVATGAKVCVFNGDHTGPVQCIQFIPKYVMFTSA